MINIDFNNYNYYPTLRSRGAELTGLKELYDQDKKRIVPLITLSKWPRGTDFVKSCDKIHEAISGGYYFLDLPKEESFYKGVSEDTLKLRYPDGNFKFWNDFIMERENAIPIVQMANRNTLKEVITQARFFEKNKGKLGFRIQDYIKDTPVVIAALSALDDTDNAIVFIDSKYIRDAFQAHVAATISNINQIRDEIPETIIVTLSTSFPSSPASFANDKTGMGKIEILERQLHASIGGYDAAIYGDHASIHSVVYDEDRILRWSARIDVAEDLIWHFMRKSGATSAGYEPIAKELIDIFPNLNSPICWGEQMIKDAAEGRPFGRSPAKWIAARVNSHLTYQIRLSDRLAKLSDDFDYDDDDLAEFF